MPASRIPRLDSAVHAFQRDDVKRFNKEGNEAVEPIFWLHFPVVWRKSVHCLPRRHLPSDWWGIIRWACLVIAVVRILTLSYSSGRVSVRDERQATDKEPGCTLFWFPRATRDPAGRFGVNRHLGGTPGHLREATTWYCALPFRLCLLLGISPTYDLDPQTLLSGEGRLHGIGQLSLTSFTLPQPWPWRVRLVPRTTTG